MKIGRAVEKMRSRTDKHTDTDTTDHNTTLRYRGRSNKEFVSRVVITGWWRGVVVSGVRRMNEVNARRSRLVPGWVTVFGRVYHLGV